MKLKLLSLITILATAFGSKAQWSELGGTFNLKADSNIYSICTDISGNVYAAGRFTNNNGNKYVAKWDGITWSELGGVNSLKGNNYIMSICSDNSWNVYAGGYLTNSNGKYYVAKWDKKTNTWSELGGFNGLAANNYIWTICSDITGNIYIGGYFNNNSGKHYVAKWNKTTNTWSELGGINSLGAYGEITSICTDSYGNVFAAGLISNTKGNNHYVTKWDGTTWSELGTGINNLGANDWIQKICLDTLGNLYAAGNFTNTSGKHYVAKWNGTQWSTLGDSTQSIDLNNNSIDQLCVDIYGNVYATGSFQNSAANSFVAKWNGANWTELGGANCLYTNAGYSSSMDALFTDKIGNIYTTFLDSRNLNSWGVIKYTNNVTPVQFLYFTAIYIPSHLEGVDLNWQTATEINTSHFNIQRSTTGKDFTTIGKVNAKGASTYTFNDPLTTYDSRLTKLYYRLEMVDKDGSKTYSEVKELRINNGQLKISPNPAKDIVTISGTNLKQVKLLDNLGRAVAVKNVTNSSTISIAVSHIAKGIYMVQATFKDGSVMTEKIAVE